MTLLALPADNLGRLLTLITGFMCDRSTSYKTYDELLAIYHSCKDWWAPYDKSDDLRIIGYIENMKNRKWTTES